MKKHILILTGILTLLVSARANQEMLAASIGETRTETQRTADQLKATLDALNGLVRKPQPDIAAAYTAFAAEVPKTEAAAAWTKTRVDWMAGEGQRYFSTWQSTVDAIVNPSLKKKAQKRLDSVKETYGKVSKSLTTANEKFQPFLSDLSDIQKTLANDITAGGVNAVRDTVSNANWRYRSVNAAVQQALKEMKRMEDALKP
ncbi:MAG: DUF2959 family protein [Verrucomicrobia bacterium]|nr:DUF2959 family protein [Verrucomicrobiota bacterium]